MDGVRLNSGSKIPLHVDWWIKPISFANPAGEMYCLLNRNPEPERFRGHPRPLRFRVNHIALLVG